ncbi:Phosphate transport regulator (distant of PhoU) [Rhodovulum sp. P5]|uniref:lipopolysaccharide assembly protein LapA domain-containing protein n=1 Tax=Rhodovulum sp. P5 TaxID=1564506 RepID=UPI0009C3115B|nr:LapA family protein [Rhodovulum sp. P5]ARE38684.1 Phosphate transport regulator (distant of PhoU) [Rhodovulum sp. P5]
MRYIRYLLLIAIAICLVVVATANRDIVTINLLADELATFSGFSYSVEVPLYVVGFAGILVGLLIGFVWEWIRESKQRSIAARQRREAVRMKRELEKLHAEKHRSEGRDEILALVEQGVKTR